MAETQYVLLKKLAHPNQRTQQRVKINREIVEEYAAALKAGAEFPPVDLVQDGTEFYIVDGFYRLEAARLAKLGTILANVEPGTLDDAILRSCGANRAHGLRRTNADKRKAILSILGRATWSGESNRWIAEKVGVDHHTVAEVRKELKPVGEIPNSPDETAAPEPPKRTGRDGKQYKATKPKQSRSAPAAKEPTPKTSGGVTFDPAEWEAPTVIEADETAADTATATDKPSVQSQMQDWNRRLVALARNITASMQDVPDGPWLDERRIHNARATLKIAAEIILAAKAGGIHEACDGTGCKGCRGTGWLTADARRTELSVIPMTAETRSA